jgi:nanoRNase/pAp phosphatase (c-di-AMP/oligoRNAs hydrolase)
VLLDTSDADLESHSSKIQTMQALILNLQLRFSLTVSQETCFDVKALSQSNDFLAMTKKNQSCFAHSKSEDYEEVGIFISRRSKGGSRF